MNFSCKFKCATWRFIKQFPVAFSLHSSHSSIFSAFRPFMWINTTRSSPHGGAASREEWKNRADEWLFGNIHQIHPKYKTQQRPFNTVNVRQYSMICEKDEIVFRLFFLVVTSAPALNVYQQHFFFPSWLSVCQKSNSHTALQSLLFFDDTIKTMGLSEAKLLWAVWSLGDFKVFSLRLKDSKKFLLTAGGCGKTDEGESGASKCLMKCGNKIEKQKLNEADFVLKFYFLLLFFRGGKFQPLLFSGGGFRFSAPHFILVLCLFDLAFWSFCCRSAPIECENLK